MVSFLTIHDIMLLFYTLEALYALSDLGRYACDKIVCVHRCIGIYSFISVTYFALSYFQIIIITFLITYVNLK